MLIIASLDSRHDPLKGAIHEKSGMDHLACWRDTPVGCDAPEAFILGRCIV